MKIHFKTLSEWPTHQPSTPYHRRETAKFSVGYPARLDLLEYELTQVNAKDIVLEALIGKRQTRGDGWPLSEAKAAGPGVILSFVSEGEPREFAADNYEDWKDNLYAVAKILEALRGINRWGGTARGKQYKGFAPALPAPEKAAGEKAIGFTSAQAAAAYLAKYSSWDAGVILSNALVVKSAFNAASIQLHPDTGGTHEGFIRLQQAREMLDKHHRERRS